MGDCQVNIVIAKSLLACVIVDEIVTRRLGLLEAIETTATLSFGFSRSSSDTTIREAMQSHNILWAVLTNTSCRLWDITVHPPVDITSWPTRDFPELQGPKSKTLYSAGWFPSGTILAIPADMTPNQFSDHNSYEDTQYNRHESVQQATTTARVEFEDPTLRSTSTTKPLPSQVMASVANRFANDEAMQDDDPETRRAKQVRRQEAQHEWRQRELQRTAKLDARIARLQEQSQTKQKNKNVSDQVLRMLVKSRATGDKKLKLVDRVYFQVVALYRDDDDNKRSINQYRYYSPQDTFAKIAKSWYLGVEQFCEILCRCRVKDDNQQEQEVYRRFPVTMRLYEAMAQGYLTADNNNSNNNNNTNQVVVSTPLIVRWYSDREDATPSILEEENGEQRLDNDNQEDTTSTNDTSAAAQQDETKPTNVSSIDDSRADPANNEFEDVVLKNVIEAMDNSVDDKGKKRKASSAAATKVKQMRIKAKAKGDAKRIHKMENRFFLEVVTVSSNAATSGFYFLAKTDPLERILDYCNETKSAGSSNSSNVWEFLVSSTEKVGHFQRIPESTIELEKQDLLPAFGRLILRRRKS